MEDRRHLILILVFSLVISCVISPVTAYDTNLNSEQVHQEINYQAIHVVETWMKKDPAMTGAEFSDSLTKGELLNPGEINERETLKDWIAYGGYTQDWEGFYGLRSALRHFYDPTTGSGLSNAAVNSASAFGDYTGYKSVPATEWAGSPENKYSFEKAQLYYYTAVGNAFSDNYYYGQAWRGVGENMHLVSDMTVPAHVRNDMHPPKLWPDAYESATTVDSVKKYASEARVSSSIDYGTFKRDHNVPGLMRSIACWTYDNFYSEGTIPNPAMYGEENAGNYLYKTVDGQRVPAAAKTFREVLAVVPGAKPYANQEGLIVQPVQTVYRPYKILDKTVLDEQQRLLIPNAVHGSALVLWEFLPQYTVTLNPPVSVPGTGQYDITGGLTFHQTPAWSNPPPVRNGAFIKVNDQSPIELPFPGYGKDLSTISYRITAKPGDKVLLYYDFGGYRIKSKVVTVPGEISPPVNDPRLDPGPWECMDCTDYGKCCVSENTPEDQIMTTGFTCIKNNKISMVTFGNDKERWRNFVTTYCPSAFAPSIWDWLSGN